MFLELITILSIISGAVYYVEINNKNKYPDKNEFDSPFMNIISFLWLFTIIFTHPEYSLKVLINIPYFETIKFYLINFTKDNFASLTFTLLFITISLRCISYLWKSNKNLKNITRLRLSILYILSHISFTGSCLHIIHVAKTILKRGIKNVNSIIK